MASRPLQPVLWDPAKRRLVARQQHGGLRRVPVEDLVTVTGGGGLSDGDYGDITVSGSGTVMSIDANAVGSAEIAASAVDTSELANDAVTDAKLRNSGARSVIGRSANSSGDPADISGAGADTVLTDSGTSLAFTAFSDLVLAGLLTAWAEPSFGDGADGATTYTGDTALTEELRATTINVDAAVTVTAKYPMRATGTVTGDHATTSILDHSGSDASVGSGGAGAAAGYASAWSGSGGAAGRGTTGNGTVGNGRTNSAVSMLGAANAGNAGPGGASGAGNSGGGLGTAGEPSATSGRGFTRFLIDAWVTPTGQNCFGSAGGGSGGCTTGGGTATSGAGGGGAGLMLCWFRVIDLSSGGLTLRAKGGAGGNATQTGTGQAGGGGGGGGGGLFLGYSSAPSGLPTIDVAGGTGGTGAGAGAVDGTDGEDGISIVMVIP